MDESVRKWLLTAWVLAAIFGGIAIVIFGPELLTFGGVLLIIAGLMSSMLMMDSFFEAQGAESESTE